MDGHGADGWNWTVHSPRSVHFQLLGPSTLPDSSIFNTWIWLDEIVIQSESVWKLFTENSPSIIFIDEIDAIATKRFDAQTGADREVQRILLELLNQMDGFDQSVNESVENHPRSVNQTVVNPKEGDAKTEAKPRLMI